MYVLHTVVWRWKRADAGLCTPILFQMSIANTILDLTLLKIVVAGLPMHAMGTATKSPSLSDFQPSSVRPPFILSERVSDMTSGRRMDFLSLIPGIVVAAAVPDRPTATDRPTDREGGSGDWNCKFNRSISHTPADGHRGHGTGREGDAAVISSMCIVTTAATVVWSSAETLLSP